MQNLPYLMLMDWRFLASLDHKQIRNYRLQLGRVQALGFSFPKNRNRGRTGAGIGSTCFFSVEL
ncbi:MAG: hypothetical protein CMM01_17935 [Rhodopirellula sp.]|nr:hypothetical protein [Rhodopirellula sp.]